MAVPQWVREQITAVAVTPGDDTETALIAVAGDEPIMIEALHYVAAVFSSGLGRLRLLLIDPASPGATVPCASYEIPAGSADLEASGRIPISLPIAAGWGAKVQQDTGAVVYVTVIAGKLR